MKNIVEIVYSLVDNVSGKAKSVQNALKGIESQSDNTAKKTSTLNKTIKEFDDGVGTASLMIGGLTYMMGRLGLSVFDASTKFEDQSVALRTLTGSAVKANMIMKDVIKTAETTPFEATELLNYVIQLKNANVAQLDLIPTMRMLGDIASGVGKDKLPQIVLAYTQILAEGRLVGNNLMQLTNATVPIMNELATNLGIPVSAIFKLKEQGKITSDMVTESFRRMTSEGGQFFNAMDSASQTTTGRFSTLSDVITQLKVQMGTGLLPAVKDVTGWLIKIAEKFNQLPMPIKLGVAMFLTFTTVVTAFGGAIMALVPLIGGVRIALTLLASSTVVGLALTGLVLAITYWKELRSTISSLVIPIQEFYVGFLRALSGISKKFDEMLNTMTLGLSRKVGEMIGQVEIFGKYIAKILGKPFGVNFNFESKSTSPTDIVDAELNRQEKILAILKKYAKEKKGIKNDELANEAEMAKIIADLEAEQLRVRQQQAEQKKAMEDITTEEERKKRDADAKKKNKELEDEQAKKEAIANRQMELMNLEYEQKEIRRGTDQIRGQTVYEQAIAWLDGLFNKRRELDALTIEDRIAHEESLLEIANLSVEKRQEIEDRIKVMRANRDQQEMQAKKASLDIMTDVVRRAGENEITVGEAVAEGVFGVKKKQLIAESDALAARLIQDGVAMLASSLGTNPIGYAHIAAGGALVWKARDAINSIKLADGGIVMPRAGGTPAIIGEAGQPEAVIPLNNPMAQSMMNGSDSSTKEVNIYIDGEPLVRGLVKIQNRMVRSGKISSIELT